MKTLETTRLEDIGFYTLSDERAKNTSNISPMWRCEMILTDRCNFNCPYCRGLKVLPVDCTEDMPFEDASATLRYWMADGLRNVRFSGGEPTLYEGLVDLVKMAQSGGVQRIAVSTNGSRELPVYDELVEAGVNDFSISLDACCANFGDKMSGTQGKWANVAKSITYLSDLTYVSVGVVVTPENLDETARIVEFAHNIGVADIRIISAAQYNKVVAALVSVPDHVLNAHPILKYRATRAMEGLNVRGLCKSDCRQCHLAKDDSVVAGKWHFPCVISMREGADPIGIVGPDMRAERVAWQESHDSWKDNICRENCLDVCVSYNNKVEAMKQKGSSNDRI